MINKLKQPRKSRRTWTPDEIDFVKKNTGVMAAPLMAEYLGRTENAVRWMIRHLNNPTTENERPWTEAEKKVLRTWFLRADGIEQVMSILPWRTRNSIIRMMDRLTTPEPGKGRSRKWRADELRILEQYYPVEGIAVASRLPGRTFCAVRSTANQRGIKSGLLPRKWTQEEWQRMDENSHLLPEELAALFPGRTQKAVIKALESVKRKSRLRAARKKQAESPSASGVRSHLSQADSAKTAENDDNRCLAWTSHDLAFVAANYGVMKTAELAKRLWRTVASVRNAGCRLSREKNGNDSAKPSEMHRNHRAEWSKRELQFVKKHYGVMKTTEIAEKLGRSVVSVRLTALNQGCGKYSLVSWTEAEEDVIRTEYARGTRVADIVALLPGRTRDAIVLRARKMGITNASVQGWSKQERELLEQFYPTMGKRVTVILPGRTELTVKDMAYKMGINFAGFEASGQQRMWSEPELRLLSENSHLPLTELAALFPGRSRASVRQALARLQSHRGGAKEPSGHSER